MEICFTCAGVIVRALAENGEPTWTHADYADTFNTPHPALPAVYLPEQQMYVLAGGVAHAAAEDLR